MLCFLFELVMVFTLLFSQEIFKPKDPELSSMYQGELRWLSYNHSNDLRHFNFLSWIAEMIPLIPDWKEIDLQVRTSKGMTNVGTARINLSPGDVAFAGAASGVVTRASCQVTFLHSLDKTEDFWHSQPLDVFKIRMQLQAEGKAGKYRGLIHLATTLPRSNVRRNISCLSICSIEHFVTLHLLGRKALLPCGKATFLPKSSPSPTALSGVKC